MGQLIWAGFLTLKKQCELVRAQALAPDECRKSCGLALCPRAALGPNCGDYTEVGDSCGACEDPIGPKTARRLRIYGFTDLPPSLPLLPGTPFTRISESSYRREGRMLSVVRVATRPLPSALRCPTGNCS